jgi:hypothetical protein
MLLANNSILIPPFYKLDRSNSSFQDLSKSFKINNVESFTKLKRYFSKLGNRNPNTGFIYCSCIVAASFPHAALMTKVSQVLQESKLSLWPRSCDHKNVGQIGWLLYSLQDMDVGWLKSVLTALTGVEIGVKWMKIMTDYGSKRERTQTAEEPTKDSFLMAHKSKFLNLERGAFYLVWIEIHLIPRCSTYAVNTTFGCSF